MKEMLIMKLKYTEILTLLMAGLLMLASCAKDLNRKPLVGLTGDNVYNTVNDYKSGIAGVYNKELTDSYFYNYWFLEEVPTDEVIYTWDDGFTFQINYMTWSSNNAYVDNCYLSLYDIVTVSNEFLRQSTDAILKEKNFSDADIATVHTYRAEARYIRALAYYNAMNEFGNVPFVTEDNTVGNFTPTQISRKDLFAYVESELLAIQTDLIAPRTAYGRADQGADWALLARLYLNAGVFTGTDRYTDCVNYCNKVLASTYSLEPKYANMFRADNSSSPEMIFPFEFSATYTQSYGTLTSIIHGELTAAANPSDYGVVGAWLSMRTSPNLVNLFTTSSGAVDQRGIFETAGQSLDITQEANYLQGYGIGKYNNLTSAGVAITDPTGTFVNINFPVLRLGDVYLMYAESVVRGGGGSTATAVNYINSLRERGFGDKSQDITAADLTTDFIFQERTREMYWEGTRRTDLIRFGKFTSSSYLWPFKGGIQAGQGVDDYRNLYPIPSSDLTVNPNLKQNPGY